MPSSPEFFIILVVLTTTKDWGEKKKMFWASFSPHNFYNAFYLVAEYQTIIFMKNINMLPTSLYEVFIATFLAYQRMKGGD